MSKNLQSTTDTGKNNIDVAQPISLYDNLQGYDQIIGNDFKGGCTTCPKAKKKISSVVRQFSKLIPEYYILYNSKSKKKGQKKELKGGNEYNNMFNWDGHYEWKQNSVLNSGNYSMDIFDVNNLNFSGNRKNDGIYNIDTTLTDHTSLFV